MELHHLPRVTSGQNIGLNRCIHKCLPRILKRAVASTCQATRGFCGIKFRPTFGGPPVPKKIESFFRAIDCFCHAVPDPNEDRRVPHYNFGKNISVQAHVSPPNDIWPGDILSQRVGRAIKKDKCTTAFLLDLPTPPPVSREGADHD